MEQSIRKNFIYNLICQLVVLLVPLICTPYLSRVLLETGVGQFSYSEAMVTYFMVFALLGSSIYAQREVSSKKDKIEEVSRTFFEMLLFRLTTMTLALVVYTFYVFNTAVDIKLTIIVGLQIFSCGLDISWFYQGEEEFKITAIVSTSWRVLSGVAIFLFVKEQSHVWVYALITSITILATALTNWVFLRKRIVKVKGIKPFRHSKGVFSLFLPTIAAQIYMILDKSLIGWITGSPQENGYYEYAEKIIRICMTLVVSLSSILLSRNAKAYADNDMETVRKNVYKGVSYMFMITIPMCFGIIAIADLFVPLYFGQAFMKSAVLMKIFAPLIVFMGIENVIGMSFLLPINKQRVYIGSVLIAAGTNFMLNVLLIPKYQSSGAVFGTVVAELVYISVQLIYVFKKGYLKPGLFFIKIIKYLISAIFMFAVLIIVGRFLTEVNIINLGVLILIGVSTYSLMLFMLKDSFFIKSIKQTFSLLKRRKKN